VRERWQYGSNGRRGIGIGMRGGGGHFVITITIGHNFTIYYLSFSPLKKYLGGDENRKEGEMRGSGWAKWDDER
jgi:hypothetical protein